MPEPVVDLLAEEWKIIADLGAGLDDARWDLPTDCPGWSVKDNLSHMIGTERMLLGDQPPEGFDDVASLSHVKNPIGQVNERWIAERRSRSGAEVLAEFVEVTGRRLEALRAMTTEDFDKEGWTPAGQAPYRTFMSIRLMDCWAHEQDIRRAAGKPGNAAGPIVDNALERVVLALPFVIGKKAGAMDGAFVSIECAGPVSRAIPVVVEGKRARVADAAEMSGRTPTVTVSMSSDQLFVLGFGRQDPAAALSAGVIAIDGDVELGRRVVESLPFMI